MHTYLMTQIEKYIYLEQTLKHTTLEFFHVNNIHWAYVQYDNR